MIGNSLGAYCFIKGCIYLLQSVTPLSILCFVSTSITGPSSNPAVLALQIWAVAETVFFIFIYLPRKRFLQKPASHPTDLSRDDRRELFRRCQETISEPETYLVKWFKGAPIEEIKRDNVKEFYCWAFLNRDAWGPEDDEELEGYADATEKMLGRKLEPGRGSARALRLTLDEVTMSTHRSLLWYLCIGVVDTLTSVCMLRWFHFHSLPYRRFFTVFPFRPLLLFSTHRTPGKTVTYWHRQHNSPTHLPVLFVHGIGIGLYPYVNFLSEIDEDIGVIAVEIMPVSFRITSEALQREAMCQEVLAIVRQHGWDRFILVSHSYGSIISTHLLSHQSIAPLIGPVVLLDPVSFLLHLPDVAYNFTCRLPKRANEHQLYYFASMDMGVSHTLFRRFFWSENILWKADLGDRRLTVVLGGKDLIVDTTAVGRYLTQPDRPASFSSQSLEKAGNGADEEWKHRRWTGKGIDLLWFEDLDHAQVFDSRRDRGRVIGVIEAYSLQESQPSASSNGVAH
ncbi:hypothetical protein B0A49_06634 [Cryomyces minteri]|uniref:AB hydrolase-1 domain-containing protein n=1 Tax=Cryomyces minteri TaxID=331657 RepID=A0A4V5NEA9_9PEZI|nr:hypothetical protein B0A49_06634 [Cryomyces minteri]